MSRMDRERFEDLKEAYVLRALTDEEQQDFEEYLAAHPELQGSVDDLRSVASLLALSPDDQQPSPDLRRRLMQTVQAEASVAAALNGDSERPTPLARIGAFFLSPGFALGLAGVAVVALLSWNVLLRSEVDNLRASVQEPSQLQKTRLQGEELPSGSSAELLRFSSQQAVLVADDLPPVDEGQTLQIWVIKGDDVKSAGLFKPENGVVTVPVSRSLEGADTIAISVEPAGGSDQPTTKPVLAANV